MDNNDIFKKLRVALQLRDDQIVEILELVDFRISKAELGAFFRNADHPNYMECGDQVLRNFLNGLIIHLRGTKENPKNPVEVLEQNRASLKKTATANTTLTEKKPAKNMRAKENKTAGSAKKFAPKKPAKNKTTPVVENVKFKNGRKKLD